MPTGFPFLKIARAMGENYGEVLRYAEWYRLVAGDHEPHNHLTIETKMVIQRECHKHPGDRGSNFDRVSLTVGYSGS